MEVIPEVTGWRAGERAVPFKTNLLERRQFHTKKMENRLSQPSLK